ncbi:MFS transporter [Neobacillus sp. D3-1R]|uniref:MFS transporter n=1 Tax=Neobacillus sp. D3-1R TaxID=3445778 RepID=UPI003FA0EFD7
MNKLKVNLTLIYGITIFQSLIFAYVIERVFAELRGLTVLDMQYLLILYSVFSIVFEIPAGVLADIWKKKYTLALGLAICFFEFFVSIFSHSFPMFGLAYFAAALGGSLRSGTLESFLYQTLKEENKENSYVQISGRLKFVKYTVSGIAAIIGGFVADRFGYEMNYWLSLFGYPIAIVLILNLHEQKIGISAAKKVEWTSMLPLLKTGLELSWKNPQLKNVLFVSAIIGAVLYSQLHEMSMLVYPDQGISVKYFGLISLGITVISAFSGFFAEKIKEMLKKPFFYILIFLIPGLSIILFGTVLEWWGVLFLMIAIGILEALTVVYTGFILDESPDELRVTISSVSSFFNNVVSIVVGLLFGYYSKLFSIHVSFQMLGIILLILILVQSIVYLKKRIMIRS